MSDGAAVALLMTRREALRRGLPVMAVFRSFAAVGVDPAIMGVGPAVAIPKAVKMAGLTLDDVDVYEINEAFASQALYCVNELGIPAEKVRNVVLCCLSGGSLPQHAAAFVAAEMELHCFCTVMYSSVLLFEPCKCAGQPERWCHCDGARAWLHGRSHDGHAPARDEASRPWRPLWRCVYVHRLWHGRSSGV